MCIVIMKCCVKNCRSKYNWRSKEKQKVFFKFPNNEQILKQWLEFTGKSPPVLSAWRVCQDHFKSEHFIGKIQCEFGLARKLLLEEGAVPTINNTNQHSASEMSSSGEDPLKGIEQFGIITNKMETSQSDAANNLEASEPIHQIKVEVDTENKETSTSTKANADDSPSSTVYNAELRPTVQEANAPCSSVVDIKTEEKNIKSELEHVLDEPIPEIKLKVKTVECVEKLSEETSENSNSEGIQSSVDKMEVDEVPTERQEISTSDDPASQIVETLVSNNETVQLKKTVNSKIGTDKIDELMIMDKELSKEPLDIVSVESKASLSASEVTDPHAASNEGSCIVVRNLETELTEKETLSGISCNKSVSTEDIRMDVDIPETLTVSTEEKEKNDIAEDLPKCRAILEAVELIENNKLKQSNSNDEKDCCVFLDKECINNECLKTQKQFVPARSFVLNFYKVAIKKHKIQYVCLDCCDKALEVYEKNCGLLVAKQPLMHQESTNQQMELVEICSSDEEDSNDSSDNASGKESFSKNDLQLIERELINSMEKVFNRIDIQNQMTWIKSAVMARSEKIEKDFDLAEKELKEVQHISDRIHYSFYGRPRFITRSLPPLDINCAQHPSGVDIPDIPPAGEIQRPPIELNGTYYAVKNKVIASWVPVKVLEQVESTPNGNCVLKNYRIKYQASHNNMVKTVSAKNLAYFDPPPVRLTIGTRVIAYFDATTLARGKEKILVQSAFYPGIIAEPIKPANKFRYLIFYDDGYTQYVHHKDVRLVCQASDKVWEDIHPASREFIKNYIEQYSVNRPMVQTQKGQSMNTESNGTWHYARVIDTDCSLILMQFDGPKNHTEWIYRGSLRLGPVFKEYQKTLQKNKETTQSRLPRRTEPFIRYTEDMEASNSQVNQQQQQRAIAKKSVSRQDSTAAALPNQLAGTSTAMANQSSTVRHLNNSTIYVEDENRPKGQVIFYTAKRNLPPRSYQPHQCNPGCLFKMLHSLDAYSPLAKPLLSGWERMKFKQKIKKSIVYRAPCGKSLRSIEEVHRYLRETRNVLNVDNFDFYPDVHCLAEYVIDSAIVQERDISRGQEKIAIPLVNYYDNTLPPPCEYAAQRIPTEGVPLNLDQDFLVGCDCEDDCSDKSKCSCWQLTIEGARYMNPNKPIEQIGYQYKRLIEYVPTGIYECNPRCKCKSNCLNRVVQHSLEMKLQVFKTSNRGWGLRCINDIPRGAFICIYAGHLLTEAKANEGGADAGDEYFADLDYIEVAEQLKEGYESDVEHSEAEEDETYQPELDDDDDFRPTKSTLQRVKNKQRLSRNSNQSQISDEDSQERQVINFNPNADMNENERECSVRRQFGKDETPYIMDAKTIGNLGRYFNHSCNPNLFVQNVFVDTHDLRFPWVAFFAGSHIRSGTELTWNYNYEVGVVPGKVLYCQCGASNCRIRLL